MEKKRKFKISYNRPVDELIEQELRGKEHYEYNYD